LRLSLSFVLAGLFFWTDEFKLLPIRLTCLPEEMLTVAVGKVNVPHEGQRLLGCGFRDPAVPRARDQNTAQ
jgi:hypothetical protein